MNAEHRQSYQPLPREECFHCGDLGVIRVSSHYENFETLMLCECEEGRLQEYRLPRWEYSTGKLFSRSKCPVSWFKPERIELDGNGGFKLDTSLSQKIEYWRAKIMLAEGYWKQASEDAT